MNKKRISRSVVALALAAALALTGCDTTDDPNTPPPGDVTTTTVPLDLTTTTVAP